MHILSVNDNELNFKVLEQTRLRQFTVGKRRIQLS